MEPWWKNSVIYQIYPRSYMDTNGDGIGDLPGIIEKLDYLQLLGIDAIWLCPVYASPNDDNGYDISDYRAIQKEFGTMEDMERLIREAGRRGIRIVMDMVFNHTSDEHKWFIEAKRSEESPYRDYYIFRKNTDGTVPNDMESVFSGSAWEYSPETDSYYLHLFSAKQPDLNYENPKVRQEMIDVLNFWIDKGVGGFRLDVVELLGKVPDQKITANGPHLHEYIHEMYEKAFSRKELMTVGECWCADEEIGRLYSDPKRGELSMIFQFEHMVLDEEPGKGKWCLKTVCLSELKAVMEKWQNAFQGDGWNSLFWNNHDLPRIVSRFGDDGRYRVESAKMLATLLHGMKGTPYIYQGEEIGMTNIRLADITEYEDIETIRMYQEHIQRGEDPEMIWRGIYAKSRDNARTPMQWSDAENAGFTTGKPWFGVNPNYNRINVKQALEDPNSIFYHYKKLIALRKKMEVFVKGDFEMLCPEDPQVFAYERWYQKKGILVICNFYGKTAEFTLDPEHGGIEEPELLLSNYAKPVWQDGYFRLRPYEALLYEIKTVDA